MNGVNMAAVATVAGAKSKGPIVKVGSSVSLAVSDDIDTVP